MDPRFTRAPRITPRQAAVLGVLGAIVVVLDRKAGDSPTNPKVAMQGQPGGSTF